MKQFSVSAIFKSDIQKVWDIVTDNTQYAWRSDIGKVEVSDDGQTFIEYTKKGGFPTTFTITLKNTGERYEFDMQNQNMSGHWTGVFSSIDDGTKIDFTEELNVKNPIMNLFAGAYLGKQQATYINDLRKALGE